MGFIAKNTGTGDFKKVPPGSYIARCYSLIDIGTQTRTGQYGTKSQPKIIIGWELFGEDEEGNKLTVEIEGVTRPMTIRKNYTMSLHEKAILRKDLAAWRGKDFTDQEALAFDVSALVDKWCMLSITESENNGKTYSNVSGISRVPTALKNNMPTAVHPVQLFNLDNPDMAIFAGFSDKMKELIAKAPEWNLPGDFIDPGSPPVDPFDDTSDIPF